MAYRGGDLAAYGRDGQEVWRREGFAVDGIELKSSEAGVVSAEIEYDYEDSWQMAQISLLDGSDL